MQKSLFGLKQTVSLPMYLIAAQDLTRKAFIIFKKKKNVRTERDHIFGILLSFYRYGN